MIHFNPKFVRYTVLFVCVAILTGCAGLAGEPLIVRTQPVATASPTVQPDRGAPVERVSLANGAALYQGAQGCQNCHGAGGQGNGVTAASFTCQLVSFTDPINGNKTPAGWFTIVTNGNGGQTNCLMPGWKNVYTEQQRWEVTSYVYSLRYSTEQIARGGELFAANCVSCHSADGSGSPDVPTLRDPARIVDSSDAMLSAYLASGQNGHTFSTISESDRTALVAHVRSLGWDNTEVIGSPLAQGTPGVQAAAPVESATFTVRGTLKSGTPDQLIPSGQVVTLRVIQRDANGNFTPLITQNATTAADGMFAFPDVARNIGAIYAVSTQFGGTIQTSTPLALPQGIGDELTLDLTAYSGRTDDPTVIRVEALRTFVDFIGPNTAYIQQGMRFANTGRNLFYTTAADGSARSVVIELPRGATDLQISANSASTFGSEQSGDVIRLVGRLPVIPDQPLTLQFAYRLPYAETFNYRQSTRYLIDQASVHVDFSSGGTIPTVGFAPGEPLELGNGSYRTFNYTRTVGIDREFAFDIQFPAQVEAERRATNTAVLIAAFALVLAMGAIIWRTMRG